MKERNWLSYVLLLCTTVFWGGSFVLTKHLLDAASPVTIIFLRMVIASVVFTIITLILYKKSFLLSGKDFLIMLAVTFFEPFLYFICETYSIKYSDPTVVAILIATIPMFIMVMSYFTEHEKIGRINRIGTLIAFVGIFVMLIPSLGNVSFNGWGIALGFGAVLSAVGYTYFINKMPEKYNSLVIITWQNLLGAVFFAPLFFFGKDPSVLHSEVAALMQPDNLLVLCILAIACSALAFMFYLHGIRHIGMTKTSIFTNLIPVATAILAYFIVGEEFPPVKILGIAIVIMGVFMVQQKAQ